MAGRDKRTEQKLQQTLRSKKNQKSLRKKKPFNAKKTEKLVFVFQ